jgi:transposase InsO family protein
VEEEGTFSSFRGLAKVFAVWGLPLSLYSDRGSHYFFTPKAGEKVDPRALTQVGRGLAQLGIEHIAAYSPQARGRCERMFRTLQDRLPKELAKVRVHQYYDGTHAIFHGPQCLARYDANGRVIEETVKWAA